MDKSLWQVGRGNLIVLRFTVGHVILASTMHRGYAVRKTREFFFRKRVSGFNLISVNEIGQLTFIV